MRTYITEKIKNTTRHFHNGDIEVIEVDQLPDNIDLRSILKAVENNLPWHYFDNLEAIKIEHLPDFDEKKTNALYRDNTFYITNQQDSTQDIVDDIVHEFAHHLETMYLEEIYGDKTIIHEFLKKRSELEFELRSEGYWTDEYDFDELKYNEKFDSFLYNRVGKNMLKLATSGMFIRPYASVSLREYFATGFEAYYLGKQQTLENISPMLYDKISELHYLKRK